MRKDRIVPASPEIAAGEFEAVIVSLDGVVTDTAGRHAAARIHESSLKLLQRLKAEGIALAAVSSSRDCRAILEVAGIGALFDISIDGVVAAERNLRGKPAPDRFLSAAEVLDCPPARAVVIEAAPAGVAAGRRGGFGLVIGVDRTAPGTDNGDAHGDALRQAGADLVVSDLA